MGGVASRWTVGYPIMTSSGWKVGYPIWGKSLGVATTAEAQFARMALLTAKLQKINGITTPPESCISLFADEAVEDSVENYGITFTNEDGETVKAPQSAVILNYLYNLGKSGVCFELPLAVATEDEVDLVAVAEKKKDPFDVLKAIYHTGKHCEENVSPVFQDLGVIRSTLALAECGDYVP